MILNPTVAHRPHAEHSGVEWNAWLAGFLQCEKSTQDGERPFHVTGLATLQRARRQVFIQPTSRHADHQTP
jgi:hypothetical protein